MMKPYILTKVLRPKNVYVIMSFYYILCTIVAMVTYVLSLIYHDAVAPQPNIGRSRAEENTTTMSGKVEFFFCS